MDNLILKTSLALVVIFGCSACQQTKTPTEIRPAIVPGVEVRMSEAESSKTKTEPVKRQLRVIGGVEPLYVLPMKSPFMSRVDTGAETSSIDVKNRRSFERDGEKWVAFDMINRETGEKHHFEKKIKRQPMVKRIGGNEERVVVVMDVKFGGEIVKAQFSLAERDRFSYQGLIGRNILTGRAIVDTSISNTLN